MKALNTFAIVLLLASTSFAEIQLAPIFQNGAVLQRDKSLPIWGNAKVGDSITVTFSGQKAQTTTDSSGKWRVTLEPLSANSTPNTLEVIGSEKITLTDILVGEVWFASGQSNMAWPIKNSFDADLEKRLARFPQIREFKIKHTKADTPASTVRGTWKSATPETVSDFSAIAYTFARDLHLALDVPIGIINATWGGTRAESWLPKSELPEVVEEWERNVAHYKSQLATWEQERADATAAGKPFDKKQPQNPEGENSNRAPYVLNNGMVAPITPAAIRGVIWYQGESNTGSNETYAKRFSALITSWRRQFAQGDIPFFWAQIAGYKGQGAEKVSWPLLREAQSQTLSLPATGQVVVIGATSDHNDIHPPRKTDVGHRFARLALARVYGDTSLIDSAPTFNSAAFEKQITATEKPASLTVSFLPTDRKLRFASPALEGFEIAGEDRVFHPAKATLEKDNTITLSSENVRQPIAARYAWRNFIEATLTDQLGLPVAPFRTDNW